ncbi:MAG: amidase family protein, partial [Chloroflexota bacterium]
MKELPRTIVEAAALLRGRKTSAVELADLALRAAHRDSFNTWLLLADERAKAQARAADERLRAGDAPLLCGIPWACKDIIGTKGVATTAGSRILEGYVPPYS